METKEHYEHHLADVYAWMIGDFESKKNAFKRFCIDHNILPEVNNQAIDLGAGNGLQTMALAELGFSITAVDFNEKLLSELMVRKESYPVEIVTDDIRSIDKITDEKFGLIVCCGDTLSHLESFDEIEKLIYDCSKKLCQGGKIILSFRDYSEPLTDINRFIPVKSDDDRILTCFLEYFPDKVMVTDLLHEKIGGGWIQKVSSYYKTRLTTKIVLEFIDKAGLTVIINKTAGGLVTLIGEKL